MVAAPGSALRAVEVHELNEWRDVELSPWEVKQMVKDGWNCHVPPVPTAVGVPITVYRQQPSGGNDNQCATWLMQSKETGFAPMSWQQEVGVVTLFRKDGMGFTTREYEQVHQYMSELLDIWGEGPPGPSEKYFRPQGFQESIQRGKLRRGRPIKTTVVGYEEDYEDDSDDSSVSSCGPPEPTSLEWPRVRLAGMSAEDLEGQEGYRGRLVEERGRYEVYLDSGREVLVVPEKLEELPPFDPYL